MLKSGITFGFGIFQAGPRRGKGEELKIEDKKETSDHKHDHGSNCHGHTEMPTDADYTSEQVQSVQRYTTTPFNQNLSFQNST